MSFFDRFKKEVEVPKSNNFEIQNSIVYQDFAYGQSYSVVSKIWDGEKTLGELGVPIKNIPQFDILRVRSYDAYAKSDVVRIITSKFFYWVIGSGLKLQSEPNRVVLESEKVSNIDFSNFQKLVESRFEVYANSKKCDHLGQKNLHELALDFFKGKYLGGDVLCVTRFTDSGPNVQFISGEYIQTPLLGNDLLKQALDKGNRVEHGVELDSSSRHIAYFIKVVKKGGLADDFVRIPAKGEKTGNTVAWLIGGNKISPDHIRSVPALSTALEKIAKLDRYTESAVGKAEQAAKIIHTITHDKNSTGESPYETSVRQKRGESTDSLEDSYVLGDSLANRIARTESGSVYNMPKGATFESFSTDIETNFGEFHSAVFNIISAGLDVPPEVAMQMYNSNYSASRAAINGWGYIVDIHRVCFANDFYIPFFKAWFEFEVLKNKIQAPQYVDAILNGNFMITDSYTQCRFTGKNMPHIDPLKEIKAIRESLGISDSTPLISREQASEMLGYGSWDENYLKFLEEDKKIPIEKKEVVNKEV